MILTTRILLCNMPLFAHPLYNQKVSVLLGTNTQRANGESQTHPDVAGHKNWACVLQEFVTRNKIITENMIDHCVNPEFTGTPNVVTLDKKIGLSRTPLPADWLNFTRIPAAHDDRINANKPSLIQKIFRAKKRDPFIYE